MKVCNNTSEHDMVVTVTMSMAEWKCLRHYAHYYGFACAIEQAGAAAKKLGKPLDDTDLLYDVDKLFNFEE